MTDQETTDYSPEPSRPDRQARVAGDTDLPTFSDQQSMPPHPDPNTTWTTSEVACLLTWARNLRASERELCISWCRLVMKHHEAQRDRAPENEEPNFRDGEVCGAEDCIEAIEGKWR